MQEKEAIKDWLDSQQHVGYQCDLFGDNTRARDKVIANLLKDELNNYSHDPDDCRYCKQAEQTYERICGE